MAQVNYDGVQSVQPQLDVPNDYQHEAANANDFGGQVAQAGEQFGQAATNVGQFFGKVQTDDAVNGAMTTVNKQLDHFRSLSGADALNAQKDTQDAIDQAFQNGRDGLETPRQQEEYDQTVRSFQQRYVSGIMASHADQQAKAFAGKTNQDTMTLALQGVANVADDPDHVEAFRGQANMSAVRQVQLDGYGSNPDAVQAARTKADQLVYKTQAETIAVKDPIKAQQIVEAHKDVLGQYYAPLMEQFQGKADTETAARAVTQVKGQVGLDVMPAPAPGAVIPPAQIHAALIGQESGGNPASPNSAQGAVGIGQVIPTTFAQYAKPGEDIHNPTDNLAVSQRIVDDLYQKSGGDPSRVAVGYFSGPGNIAPVGSPTPWINDTKDATGKSVSSYVSDVNGRLQTPAVSVKGDGYAKILAMNLNPRAQEQALSMYSREVNAAEVASMTTAQAQKAASDQSENQWISKILTNPTGLSDADIAKDTSLSGPSKNLISNILREHLKGSEDGTAATYGPKFYDVLKAATAPPGDPARISDQNQVLQMALPGQGLTLAGAKEINGIIEKNKTAEGSAESKIQAGALAYAKHQLSFEADYGFTKVRDPAGEDKFNIGFTPAFMSYWQKGIAANKTPQELVDPKNLDPIIAPFKRTPAQLQADQIQSGVEAPAGAVGPAPVLPNGMPSGSLFSPSRQQWKDPSGKVYDSSGKPLDEADLNLGKNRPWTAGGGPYSTPLSPEDESKFQDWVKQNNVPFDPGPKSDYDMRGFWKGMTTGDANAATGTNQNDGKLHYSDYWKTPYHKSFSAESKFADRDKAPHWNDKDQLVTPDGRVVFDERAK